MSKELRVLILEDVPSDAELAQRELKTVLEKFTVEVVETEEDFLNSLKAFNPDLILSDYQLPSFNGLSALLLARGYNSFIPFIILTGSINEDTAVECMKAGADDYVIKDRIKRLAPAVLNAIQKKKMKLAQRNAEMVNMRLSTAVHQSGEAIIITDTQGKIEYVNPAFEHITGYSSTEILGKNPRILKSGKQNQSLYEELWNTVLSGRIWHGKIVDRAKDGSLYKEKISISPVFNTLGCITNYVAVMHDITKEERLEQQFQQAQKMESIGLLAGGVAHDLNNMLTIINGYSEHALSSLASTDKWYEEFREINNAGYRSANMTRQLLTFSRKQPIEPRLLDLNNTINDILKMLYRLIGEEIKLIWTPRANLWPIYMDPIQIDQILMNICINARDAMADNGNLIIRAENVTLDEVYCQAHAYAKPGSYVMLTISDDGCGMDEEMLLKIFDPFFTTKAVGEGTGLGLAVVYGIVKQNEGLIHTYSKPGLGTTFKIYFPRHNGADFEDQVDREMELPSGNGEIILLVDDEIAILRLMQVMLESMGYGVIAANTPQDALRLAKEQNGKFDLLMTDIVMPWLNGRELAKQLQTIYPGIKVLLMSGVMAYRGVFDKEENFIRKPFSHFDLAVKLKEVFKS